MLLLVLIIQLSKDCSIVKNKPRYQLHLDHWHQHVCALILSVPHVSETLTLNQVRNLDVKMEHIKLTEHAHHLLKVWSNCALHAHACSPGLRLASYTTNTMALAC